MSSEPKDSSKTGLYERTVGQITEWVKPSLHEKTKEFIHKSVEELAPDNPRFARMIEFEVRRRGDGAGLTQDVAEPLLWTGVKTTVAVAIAVIGETVKHGKFKLIGYAGAVPILLNNAVELFRLVPRYTAGLQGSLAMAKDRWESIEKGNGDPFKQQGASTNPDREINPEAAISFSQKIHPKAIITPTSVMEQAANSPSEHSLTR